MSEFFESESSAIDILKDADVYLDRGTIHLPKGTFVSFVMDAVDYLVKECDYEINWID